MTDEEIAVLNADYRNKPRPTDVLSFAQNEGEAFPTGLFSMHDATMHDATTNDATTNDATAARNPLAVQDGFGDSFRAFSLGDIVISIETAQRQARERHHDLRTEISFLVVHGTLHLLGYDHGTSAQRRAMWKQQDEIVQHLTAAK